MELSTPTAGIINLTLRSVGYTAAPEVAALLPPAFSWVLDDRHTASIPFVVFRWSFEPPPPPVMPWEYEAQAWVPLWLLHKAGLMAARPQKLPIDAPMAKEHAGLVLRDPKAVPTDCLESRVEVDGAWLNVSWKPAYRAVGHTIRVGDHVLRSDGHSFRVPRLLVLEAFRGIFDLRSVGV